MQVAEVADHAMGYVGEAGHEIERHALPVGYKVPGCQATVRLDYFAAASSFDAMPDNDAIARRRIRLRFQRMGGRLCMNANRSSIKKGLLAGQSA